MNFHSYVFAGFFFVVLGLYQLPLGWTLRRALLLAASWFFYAAWDPRFLPLLWASTVVDWVAARRIHQAPDPVSRRRWLGLSLASNLGLLGFFKYGNFLWNTASATGTTLGGWGPWDPLHIVLPVGISFYTFQTLSYTLDVYQGRLVPDASLLDYSLYVAFFPQLVAGPIVRAREFLPQCRAPRATNERGLGWGLALMVYGLFQKVVVADTLLAPSVEAVFDGVGAPTMAEAWVAVTACMSQIYFDFSGYSLVAIGAARCLGFELPENFRAPFASVGFAEWWRRWHITLSTWLHDYLYRPLRQAPGPLGHPAGAALVTMILGGLWHGAAWRFALWGGALGVALLAERALGRGRSVPAGARPVAAALTFLAVSSTTAFFRGRDLARAREILWALVPPGRPGPGLASPGALGTAAVVVAITWVLHWRLRDRSLTDIVEAMTEGQRAAALATLLVSLVLVAEEGTSFVYFQF